MHLLYEKLSLHNSNQYLSKPTRHVKLKTSWLLPSRFALMFGGQETAATYYTVGFDTFPATNQTGYQSVCLALLSLDDRTTQKSDEHITFLKFLLKLLRKSIWNLVVLIDDNCNINRVIGCNLKILLLEWASHRPQLAVKEMFSKEEIALLNSKSCWIDCESLYCLLSSSKICRPDQSLVLLQDVIVRLKCSDITRNYVTMLPT